LELTRLASTLVERLLVLEERAAHAHAVAAVAEHLAWRERQRADRLQAVLSEVKVWIALLPDAPPSPPPHRRRSCSACGRICLPWRLDQKHLLRRRQLGTIIGTRKQVAIAVSRHLN
jgi:hypothetical protein